MPSGGRAGDLRFIEGGKAVLRDGMGSPSGVWGCPSVLAHRSARQSCHLLRVGVGCYVPQDGPSLLLPEARAWAGRAP